MNTGLIIAIVFGVLILLAGISVGMYFLFRKNPTGGDNGGGDNGGGNGGGGPTIVSQPIPTMKPLPKPLATIAIPNSPGARLCPKTANNFIVPGLIAPWKGDPQPLVLSNYKFDGDTAYTFSNGTFYFREAYTGDNC